MIWANHPHIQIDFEASSPNLVNDLQYQMPHTPTCNCKRMYTGRRGLPRLEILKREEEILRKLHFPWTKIAKLLGISTKTLQRRRDEFQIDDEESWSSILSEAQLRETKQEIMSVTPGIGLTRMLALLEEKFTLESGTVSEMV